MAKDSGVSAFSWVICGVFIMMLIDDARHSKWRYAISYGVSSNQVHIDKMPHDCGFLTAPFGDKNCEYEPTVLVTRWATSTIGSPIISYDDGKTWYTYTPDAGENIPKESSIKDVHVAWTKKEE